MRRGTRTAADECLGTTRNHLSAIMRKLDAHSRIEAIRVAEERGWL